MAEDIKIRYDSDTMEGDINFLLGDLERENGLESAVLISLFTDRRARDDDPLDDIDDKRGWWGDLTVTEFDNDEIGSKLWLLDRSKTTQENLNLARDYITKALQWMIDDGVAVKIDVETERQGTPPNDRLAFKVIIYKKDETNETFKYDGLWTAQFGG
jgi:phage gp46-like protein